MPQKLNKAGQMQDYVPKGNGDASGEYGTSNGTNKNYTESDKKKSKANVITENKSVVVGGKSEKESVHDFNTRTWYEVEKKPNGNYNLKGNDGSSRSVSAEELEKIRKSSPLNDKKKTIKVRDEDVEIVEKMPDGFAVDEVLNKTSPYTPDGYLWISDAETSSLKDRQYKLIEKDKWYNRGKETKANIINDDLTGKKDNYNKALDDLKKWETFKDDDMDARISKADARDKYIKNSDYVNEDTKLQNEYVFESMKGKDVNKIYDLIKETGIDPKSIYDKGNYPNAEFLVREKILKLIKDGKVKIDYSKKKIPTYGGRDVSNMVVGTLMENMRYELAYGNKFKNK